ncbi:MAG: archaemetzincin [Pseudomonadota bacterium]
MPQTFEEYVASSPVRPAGRRFVLQPLDGKIPFGETLREYAAIFFGVETRLAAPLPMPLDTGGDSTLLLHHLADRIPDDAFAVLGVTTVDLHARRRAFVFGESSLKDRAGICSFRRFGTPGSALFLKRALRLVAHEGSHLRSLPHCPFPPCVLQPARSLAEFDRHALQPCPDDLKKLEWNAGFDRWDRRERLRTFMKGIKTTV